MRDAVLRAEGSVPAGVCGVEAQRRGEVRVFVRRDGGEVRREDGAERGPEDHQQAVHALRGGEGGKNRKKTAKGEAPGRIVRRDEEPTKGRSSFGSRWTIRRRRGENRKQVGKPTTRDERDGAGCRFIFPKLMRACVQRDTPRTIRTIPSLLRLGGVVSSRSFSRVVHSSRVVSSRVSFSRVDQLRVVSSLVSLFAFASASLSTMASRARFRRGGPARPRRAGPRVCRPT